MPAKTLYVRDQDQEVWVKAEQLTDGASLSAIVTESLRRYIAEKEAAADGFERVEMEIRIREDNRPTDKYRKVAFQGKELASTEVTDYQITAYLTTKGKLLFYYDELRYEPSLYRTYDSLQEVIDENSFPATFIAEIAEAMGADYVEELDV